VKLYKKTKLTDEQEDKFVFPHVMAMTKEGLNSKADIAYELGCRDLEIEGLREKLDAWAEKYADLKIESDANQWAHDNMQEQLASAKADGIREAMQYATSNHTEGVRAALRKYIELLESKG